ncbi:MAG TPA: ATP-binding cassette domain-containing protein [Roseiarcus sp.]|nr:ATP-binding cassette domain-containing protein [Roseiarcus sp.]
MSEPLLSVENVSKRFRSAGHEVAALTDVSISVTRGECHAIIGESGSGKTTLGGLILGLFEPTAGLVRFKGQPLSGRRPLHLKRAIQLIQQNPLSALNARRTVGQSIRLALDVHNIGERSRRGERVAELLGEVGLPADYARRTPRGLSGGERQRIAIARALACEPELLVLDEPTSALDVLVQARVLQLLMRARREHELTYVFITHDLAVVRGIADRVSVFRKGRLVEAGSADEIFAAPQSAYTRSLLGAIPVVTAEEAKFRDRFRVAADAVENGE